jgi:ParB family chromosome partitioning protein
MSHPPTVQLIPVASIQPSPYQYRARFDDAKQQQLIESLRASGLSTPILVRPSSTAQGESGQSPIQNGYQLVSGERRWRAAKELGWESIRAICEEMTDAEAAARVVIENEMRTDTNVMEKAAGYKRLTQPPCNMTLEEIAKRFGLGGRASPQRIIALLDQPEPIQDLLSRGNIGERHVRSLSRIKDLDARVKLAKRAAEEDWSVRMTEEKVAKVLAKAGKGPSGSLAKTAPANEYDYNGFHCKLVADEVVISGRNFKRTKELVRQFVADYQSALECFLRDIDGASAEQFAAASPNAPGLALTGAAAPADVATAADLMKQVEAAGQPLKDLFSEIGKALGSANTNKESGGPVLSDLITFFKKPKPSG